MHTKVKGKTEVITSDTHGEAGRVFLPALGPQAQGKKTHKKQSSAPCAYMTCA